MKQEEPIEAPIGRGKGLSRGGLTVTPFRTRLPRGFDEWICIWFNDAIYTITNLRELREAKSSFPDVKEYAGFNPLGHRVSSARMILSFDPVCVRYDLVVSTDTCLHLCAPEPSRLDIVNADQEAREQEAERENRAAARANRALLVQGGLDLGGNDETLDSKANSTTLLSESTTVHKAKGSREDSFQMVSSPIKKLSWGKNKSKHFFKNESLSESKSRAKGKEKMVYF